MPSLPVLIEDLKFISSKTRSKLFSLNKAGRFSGFFSVTTFFTSVFNNNLTAIKTSGSSSITSMDVFFKLIFPVHFVCDINCFRSIQDQIVYKKSKVCYIFLLYLLFFV